MKHRLYFFRHGESAANAGAQTTDNALINLTPKGVTQSKAIAAFFTEDPYRAIVSPFLRARQTAGYALAAFPGIALEEWPIQEFIYLSPEKSTGITAAEKETLDNAYWNKADPFYRDSPQTETFQEVVERIDAALAGMASLLEQYPVTVLFAHGFFMKALRWRATEGQGPITGASMSACREYVLKTPLENGSGFQCTLEAGRVHIADLPLPKA